MTTLQVQKWAFKTEQDFGRSLCPKEGENWATLYQRLYWTIFSSPTGALHRAAALGCEVVVQRLVQGGHDVNELDEHGYSPLIHAVWKNALPAVEILLRLQADIEKKYNCRTPLESALSSVSRGKDNASAIAHLIIERTPRIKARILQEIATQGNKVGLNLLLHRGFDINLADEKGDTVLHHLVKGAYPDTDGVKKMGWLISRGANVNIPNNEGETPLHHAMGMHDIACINLLLDQGADLFAVDKKGNGCISWALFEGPPDYIIARERKELAERAVRWGIRAAPYALRGYLLYKKYIGP
jgi:ankyrin repeat protein